jgi:DNA-binding NarL/FixJ family response regulator
VSIRIVLADDNAAFRDGFLLLARSLSDLEVVGVAGTGREAVLQAERLQPDVVLMDLQMPDIGGIDATRMIAEASPHIRVLVLTMLEDDETVLTAMRAGASGYLVKGAPQTEIRRAIEAVVAGEVIFGPAIARRMLELLARPTRPEDPFPELTTREREILALVAEGATNVTVARQLSISDKTVRNHLSNVFTKLQVADRGQAIIRARQAGLGS